MDQNCINNVMFNLFVIVKEAFSESGQDRQVGHKPGKLREFENCQNLRENLRKF